MLNTRLVLIRGSTTAFVVYVLAAAIAFLLHILLTRVMSVEQYRIYVYVLSWLSVLALFGNMGIDSASMRFVAANTAREEWNSLSGFLQYATRVGLTASIIISGAGAIAVWALHERISPELQWTFWIGFFLLPIISFTKLRQAALCGLRRADAWVP